MEYTGKYTKMYSTVLSRNVRILEYKTKGKAVAPWCTCSRCGKPLWDKMYVVQDSETGIEELYFGVECIKHFD